MSDRTPPKFRRIVTGHDSKGDPIVLIDADATNHKFPDIKVSSTLMWSTDGSPTSIEGDEDEGNRILGTVPPPSGSRFTMMEFQPGNDVHGLHRTDTVDYAICISGKIDMFLDDTNFVTMNQGDVLIQRGTWHAWANRYQEPCKLAVVLLDAEPKREGSIAGLKNAR